MGCGGSKTDEDKEGSENEHTIAKTATLKRGQHILADNEYLNKLNKFYKDQNAANSESFQDKIFPPEEISIMGTDKNSERRAKALKAFKLDAGKIKWKRAKDIFGADAKLFGKQISMTDIIRGDIPNCYFVSVISAISEYPVLISQLFRTKQLNDKGCIEIALRINGEWQVVTIDDYLPVDENGNLVFARSKSGDLWPCFLEKAWAKINGGYLNILQGDPVDVFETFTPFSTVNIDLKKENKNSLWKNIIEALEQECIITCTVDENQLDLEKTGLVPNHTFALIGAYEREVDGQKIRLVKLRNPSGDFSWSGDYSYGSDKWTDAARKAFPEFKESEKEDGLYWMSYTDFCKFFKIVDICIPMKPFNAKSVKFGPEFADGYNIIKIKLLAEGVIQCELSKSNSRFDRTKTKPDILIANLLLFKVNGDKIEYVASSCNEPFSVNAQPGDYIFYFNVDYKHGKFSGSKGYMATVSSNTTFQLAQPQQDSDLTVLRTAIKGHVVNIPKYKPRFEDKYFIFFTGNRFEKTSFGFAYFKNPKNKERHFRVSQKFKNLEPIAEKMPNTIKLNKDEEFLYLANRVKPADPFQTGISLKMLEQPDKKAATQKENPETLKKFTQNKNYEKEDYDFRLDQK